MREESHIDDMRAALRGDRERAEQARLRSTENVREQLGTAIPEPVPEPQHRRRFLGRLRKP